jgi:hypothetical protein
MPKKSMDYSQTVIYKIVCLDLEVKDLYVGSSTNLVKRRCSHKGHCTNENDDHYETPVYVFIRAHGGWANWQVVLVEEFPCKTDEQRRARERYWMEELNASLNTIRSIRTHDEKLASGREGYARNIEFHNANDKIRYAEHRDTRLEAAKVYYKEHKDEIKQRISVKVKCECGTEVKQACLWSHRKNAKHAREMAKLHGDAL